MSYIDWWDPYRLKRMSPYYRMFCTPNNGFVKGGVNKRARYDFSMIKFKIRGYEYYIQRRCKGKWIH